MLHADVVGILWPRS